MNKYTIVAIINDATILRYATDYTVDLAQDGFLKITLREEYDYDWEDINRIDDLSDEACDLGVRVLLVLEGHVFEAER